MPTQGPDPDAERALQQLQLLEVAKDLFLSDWYRESTDAFFEGAEREVLRAVAEASRQELEETRRVVEEWQEALARGGAPAPDVRAVARVTRHDFLRTLVDAKEAAWHVYEMAADAAPPGVQARLMELGARDLRHANRLRELLQDGAEERAGEIEASGGRGGAHRADR